MKPLQLDGCSCVVSYFFSCVVWSKTLKQIIKQNQKIHKDVLLLLTRNVLLSFIIIYYQVHSDDFSQITSSSKALQPIDSTPGKGDGKTQWKPSAGSRRKVRIFVMSGEWFLVKFLVILMIFLAGFLDGDRFGDYGIMGLLMPWLGSLLNQKR